MADPYEVLGVARDASQADIRKAYRRLAKKYHPDLNPGDATAEKRFKEISAAHGIVGDEEKRMRFDKGEIDDTGSERPEQQYYRYHADREPAFKYYRQTEPGGSEDLGDIFADLFGMRGGARTDLSVRGGDIHYMLTVDFLEAVNGAKKSVTMPDGKRLAVTIPVGFKDGQTLRLRGEGRPGLGGGESGDALVTVNVAGHPVFTRDGDTIRSVLPITLNEALSGGKVRVQTVSGTVNVSVPKRSNTGDTLRLRGKGVMNRATGKRSDHLVELRVMFPEVGSEDLARLVADWEREHPYDPRRGKATVSWIGETELCEMFELLDADTLRHWVAAGFVHGTGADPVRFDEADVARVRLICELRHDLDVEEASLSLVLSLMDQLYDLRRSMRALAGAIAEQPSEVRVQIMSLTRRHLTPGA